VRAVAALCLIAAVRRVREPGCKFDELVLLENEEQGTNKSTGLQAMAVRPDWFTDSLPLHANSQKTIEILRGKWIVEVAELSGMKRADTEHIKAMLSRQWDRARMAYGRLVEEVPRQCVFFGTTNASEYLRDETGNRRFWPVKIKRFDLDALKRDREQLWAEACVRERANESIRLDPALWAEAGKEQRERVTHDPYYETLLTELHAATKYSGCKIRSEDVWTILNIRGNRTQEQNNRMGDAMRRLGWRRSSKNNLIWVDGALVVGYVRGKAPWRVVQVERSNYGTEHLDIEYVAAEGNSEQGD